MTDIEIIAACARFVGGWTVEGGRLRHPTTGQALDDWNPLTDWTAAGQLLVKAAEKGLDPLLQEGSGKWECYIGTSESAKDGPLRAICEAVANYQMEAEK